MYRSVITGTGKCIPASVMQNDAFLRHEFFGEDGKLIETAASSIIRKFSQITGINERRYAGDELVASDLAAVAAEIAIQDSGADRETLDMIVVAHNYGDVRHGSMQSDTVPSLAARVKQKLGIANASCVAYDVLFGCPGWLQGLIQSDVYFRAGDAKKALIIGAETLSRVTDDHDRDSMIFSDGAGACVLEYRDTGENGSGILSACALSHTADELDYIYFGASSNPERATAESRNYIKMKGRKVYEYALTHVPAAMKTCLDKTGVPISSLKKVFIHQANEKMDDAIIKAFYKLYDAEPPAHIMPMSIQWLGNSSVATIPTLYDLVRGNELENHALNAGDIVMFASVGAGMNINAVCYRY